MSVTNHTNYVGNWRGEFTAGDVITDGGKTATVPLIAAIGRKGTGTLVTATYNYKIGTSSGGQQIAHGSKSLNKDGWTSSNQSREIWVGSTTVTMTTSTQSKTYYDSSQYHTSSTTSNYYTTSVTVTIPAIPTHTITLNNQSATSAGSTAVYAWYEQGIYKEAAHTNKMTTSANAITVPTRTGYTFGGYYTSTGGGGTQMITASGYLTSSFTTTYYKAAATLYAKWTANELTFTNQTIKKVFSTSAQTFSVTAATNGTGSYTYSEVSEKNSAGTATSYISISGTTVTIAANTPAGTYTYVIRAKDNNSAKTKDATYTITLARVVLSASSGTLTYPTAATFTVTINTSGGTLSVSSSATGTATVSISSTTVTVTPKAVSSDGGKSTITVTSAANGNYCAASATYTATVNRGTITLTPTAYNAAYDTNAHSASIKSNVASTTISYGTSTSYGQTLTATTANTNYSMANVTRTTVGTTTVYYKGSKTGYKDATSSTTITISKATNPMTYAAQSWSCKFSTSAQTKTLSAAASAQGAVSYSLQSQKQRTTTVSYFTFNISTRVLTMAANTPPNTYTVVVRAHADGNNNYNSKDVDSTVSVVVSKADISPTVTMAGWTYGGTATNPSVSGNSGSGTVTYNYKVSTAADSTYTTTKPSNAGTYTVRASIAATTNYNAGTATTNFTIAKATPTTFTVTGATLNYNGSAQTLVSAASITGGGTIYYGLGSSTTSAPSSWSTTKPTATNVGSYYIWAKADASDNYNAVSQVYKATATIKPVMWLKYHANGGTIADAPHKYSDTQYFKLNNSIVQLSSTSTGTFSDVVDTIYTSTTYSNLYNVTTFNITRPGHHVKSGAAAYNTATNGTGVDVNQDNTAATDTNPVTTKRINGGTEITANATKTLYVNWVANTWTFTFAGGGNTGGSMSNQVHTYGVALALPAVGFTKTGYSFKRWNYNNSNYYNDKQEISGTWTSTNGNTYTLTAEWTANTYEVTLNANGGSGGTGSVTATYDSAMPSATMPTRLGYTFAGYYDAASGGTQYYTAAGASARAWNKTAATTLYAHWNMITVPAHVKIDSAWKNGKIWVKVNGTWKQASVGYIKVSGTWKQIK